MSKEIQSVFDAVNTEFEEFKQNYKELISSDVKFVRHIIKYLFKKQGKQIRPLFVILSAGINGDISKETYRVSSLIEILHTATLVHDDIVDDAKLRRGAFTINAIWKNKVAVLIGDYLLAKGLLVALDNNYFELLKIVSDATRKMSEGELMQIENSKSLKTTEETYFQIIEKKTAVLFGVCFKVGAFTAKANTERLELMYNIGLNAGMAFQIKDDLLDIDTKHTQKQSFIDLKEQKLTLPVIHALNNSSLLERKKMQFLIKKMKKSKKKPTEIIKWLNEKGSIEYAETKMREYRDNSLKLLLSLPKNKYRDLIEKTIYFICERNN